MITQVRIENYKSIVDTGWVDCSLGTTVLVGPNEAGKTNFLEALKKFSPEESISEKDLSEYLEDHSEGEQTPNCRISVRFENEEIRLATGSRRGVMPHQRITGEIDGTLHKFKDGRYEFTPEADIPPLSEYQNERRKLIERLAAKWGRDRVEELREYSSTHPALLREQLEGDDTEAASEFLRQFFSNTSARISDKEDIAEEEERLLQEIREDETRLDNTQPVGTLIAEEVFSPTLYDEFGNIPDRVTLEALSEQEESEKYVQFLSFIGLPPDEIHETSSPDRRQLVKRGTERFEEVFNNYWIEDGIEFDLDLVGDNIELLISDNRGTEQFISQRSQGFQHFLSFMIEYVQNMGSTGNIVLIDDPDLHLHPSAEKEFRSALQNVAEDQHIIYSTHSPYMIDKTRPGSIRLVKKGEGSTGTEVISDFSLASKLDEDVLQPVRAALGATFADSLFASKRTVLVEGYTDRIYLNRVAQYLRKKEGVDSLSYDVSILDVNGASNIVKYARLLEAENYSYAVLVDNDQAGKTVVDKLNENDGISSDNVITPAETHPDYDPDEDERLEMEIEGLFSEEFFAQRVAELYDNVSIDDVKDVLGDRNSKREQSIVDLFNQLRGKEGYKLEPFEKSDVADHIDTGVYNAEFDLDERSLQRFKRIIVEINSCFASSESDSEENPE